MTTQFATALSAALDAIRVLPRRMLLDTPGVAATVPMLRGVWGAALHDLDPAVLVVPPLGGCPKPAEAGTTNNSQDPQR